MSAKDTSAIRYVASLIHRKNGKRTCLCERCSSIARVVKLASSSVSLRRINDTRKAVTRD